MRRVSLSLSAKDVTIVQGLLSGIRPYLALTLLCLALYLPGLAAIPPLDRDEARFAQATTQMIETGDHVRIYYQNELRTKKPVGIYWLQAATVSLLDAKQQIWAYRLPSVLSGIAATLLTFFFGMRLFGRETAFLGAALLGSALILVLEAHQAKTDAALLACVTAAQGALALFYLHGRKIDIGLATPKGHSGGGSCGSGGCSSGSCGGSAAPGVDQVGIGVALTFWLAQGIGILIKGPIVPMISLLTVIALVVADRRALWLRNMRVITGLILVAAVVGPWFAAVSSATQGAFVGDSVKQDLLPKLLGAQESHGAPPGYYLALMMLTLWPASLFALPALLRGWKLRAEPAVRFCLAWIIPGWIVFELVPTKLPHYTLPAYPAIALLIAAAVLAKAPILGGRLARGAALVWMLVGLALAGAALAAPLIYGSGIGAWNILAALCAIAAALLPPWRLWRGDGRGAILCALLAGGLTMAALLHGVMPGLDRLWLSRRVAEVVRLEGSDGPVAAAGFHEPSLVFLLGTGTVLTGGAQAADHMIDHPGTIAVIADFEEQPFRNRLGERQAKADLLAELPGFNYSRGKPVTLRLYRLDR